MGYARLILILISLLIAPPSFSQAEDISPSVKPDGTKYRIAFYEGGQYPDYLTILKQTLNSLMEYGWLEQMEFPEFGKDHKQFWQWASTNIKSDYLELVSDGYFSPGDFDTSLRKTVQDVFFNRADEFELVIAMGTWAGQDLANDNHTTPVMIGSTSDPIGAGIIKSAEDSGFDHIHAKVDPMRYYRQIKIFHEIIDFKKLGVIYEPSIEGRTYAAMDVLEERAEALGFELVLCEAPFSGVDIEVAKRNVVSCSAQLAPLIDAAYITVHRGNTTSGFKKSVSIFNQNSIPTFSQLGAGEVQNGALMSISQAGFKYVGQFHAKVAIRILKGEKPGDIDQVYVSPARIAINMTTAKQIGFRPTVDILLVADEIAR